MSLKHRLSSYFQRNRKSVFENLGLVVALLAAAFAGWSGYEAHESRLDVAQNEARTIELQKKSVDAQLAAMRLDERPFVSVQSSLLVGHRLGDKIRLEFTYKIVASGKTPAFDITLWAVCLLDLPSALPVMENSLSKPGFPFTPLLLDEGGNRTCHINLVKGVKAFVLVGNVTYRDYFHAPHKTPFCIRIFPEGGVHLGRNLYSEYACSDLSYESD